MVDNSPERLAERLAKWTDRGPADACWPWTGSLTSNGYGRILIQGVGLLGAHRVALALALDLPLRGPWVARHSCDNPACVNPRHLLAGTQVENMADARERGRLARGSAKPNARLTADQVRAIRREVADGVPHKEIAARYGVHPVYVGKLARREAWAWLE